LVHFDSIDLGMFAPAAEGFRKALNHHNCESAMAYRRAEKESNPLKKAYLWHQARKVERMERALCPRFDVNLAVSELDVQTLQQGSPKAHFHIVENGTDTDYFRPASDNLEEPDSLIFAGSLRWYPNVSAIRFFVSEVWPRLKRQCPAVRLYLAGQKPPDSLVEWLRKYPDIIVIPTPEDIRPWVWKAAVFVCPILDGGGTKLKILDALALGKAVVSTRIGCEGLQVREGVDVLLADTPENFTAQVKRALEDTELRKRLGESGRRVVEEKYSWDVVGRHLHDAYRSMLSPAADQ
jgi:glycosyltransferase involved in cell wall biosynthesis